MERPSAAYPGWRDSKRFRVDGEVIRDARRWSRSSGSMSRWRSAHGSSPANPRSSTSVEARRMGGGLTSARRCRDSFVQAREPATVARREHRGRREALGHRGDRKACRRGAPAVVEGPRLPSMAAAVEHHAPDSDGLRAWLGVLGRASSSARTSSRAITGARLEQTGPPESGLPPPPCGDGPSCSRRCRARHSRSVGRDRSAEWRCRNQGCRVPTGMRWSVDLDRSSAPAV